MIYDYLLAVGACLAFSLAASVVVGKGLSLKIFFVSFAVAVSIMVSTSNLPVEAMLLSAFSIVIIFFSRSE